jgi:hypothetical protein
MFWNAGGVGWSIGKTAYLETGSHWHRSGLDSEEPWQGEWEKNVSVECIKEDDEQLLGSLADGQIVVASENLGEELEGALDKGEELEDLENSGKHHINVG